MEGKEVVGLTYLRSGMTLEGQTGISFRHATAIVYDLYRRASSIDYHYLYVAGAGINGILYQFLDDRGRALNDLACSNLIGYGVGKQLDYIRHESN